MTLEDFHLKAFLEDIDLYGGDLTNWPHDKRVEAEKLLQKSPDARTQLAAMCRAETILVKTRIGDLATSGDIAARAVRKRQDRPSAIAIRRASWLVAGTAALALGLLVGILPFGEQTADLMGAALGQSGGTDVW